MEVICGLSKEWLHKTNKLKSEEEIAINQKIFKVRMLVLVNSKIKIYQI